MPKTIYSSSLYLSNVALRHYFVELLNPARIILSGSEKNDKLAGRAKFGKAISALAEMDIISNFAVENKYLAHKNMPEAISFWPLVAQKSCELSIYIFLN